jgi:hypothetical protein
MIREMFEDMPVISSILLLILLGFVFICLDVFFAKSVYDSGNVVDKHYSAESHKTGTGVGVTSSGQTGVVITSSSEPEKFLLIIKTNSGKVITAKCEPELYYQKEIGNQIEVAICKGRFTGLTWSIYGIR